MLDRSPSAVRTTPTAGGCFVFSARDRGQREGPRKDVYHECSESDSGSPNTGPAGVADFDKCFSLRCLVLGHRPTPLGYVVLLRNAFHTGYIAITFGSRCCVLKKNELVALPSVCSCGISRLVGLIRGSLHTPHHCGEFGHPVAGGALLQKAELLQCTVVRRAATVDAQ